MRTFGGVCLMALIVAVHSNSGYLVFHIRGSGGRYQIQSVDHARQLCGSYNGRLATMQELRTVQAEGMDNCDCGYLDDGSVALPLNRPRPGCGNAPGIRTCPTDPTSWGHVGWDAYCVPVKKIGCSNQYSFGSFALKYKRLPNDWANLFVDMTFPAAGTVAGWTYYSLRPDVSVFAAVYRPLGNKKFKLVGRNRLPLGRVGRVHWIVDEHYQISVKKGDFIGLHYSSTVDFGLQYHTVIPYAEGPDYLCTEDDNCVKEEQLSSTWEIHRHEEQLFHKRNYVLDLNHVTEKELYRRAPALRPTMCAVDGAVLPTQATTLSPKSTTSDEVTTPGESDLTPEPAGITEGVTELDTTEAEPETESEPETTEPEPDTTEAEPETTESEPETTEADPDTTEAEPETTESEPETLVPETTGQGETETSGPKNTTTKAPTTTTVEPTTTTNAAPPATTDRVQEIVTEQGEIEVAEEAAREVPCHFPFLYRKQLVYACTTFASDKAWCATEEVYDGSHWRYCHQGDQTAEDMPCHFPFTYLGRKYHSCIQANSQRAWCAVAPVYTPHAWKYCSDEDASVEELPCHIPFEYNGKQHNMCIKAGSSNYWCATEEKYGPYSWRNCREGDPLPEGMSCRYPYIFEGKEYNTCITKGDTKPWCAVEKVYNRENWRYCREGDKFPEEKPCHLPFEYQGKKISSCISVNSNRPWCSTVAKYDRQNWRYCRQVEISLNEEKVSTVDAAKESCEKLGKKLAMERDARAAFENGSESCVCGWLSNGKVVSIVHEAREDCGTGKQRGISECPHTEDGFSPICVKEE